MLSLSRAILFVYRDGMSASIGLIVLTSNTTSEVILRQHFIIFIDIAHSDHQLQIRKCIRYQTYRLFDPFVIASETKGQIDCV